jgi:hypothetical protein
MENTPISNSMRISRRDGAWLIAAVLLHGCLLLIPLTHYSPVAPEPEFLSVSLQTPADPKIQAVEPPITPAPVERPEPEREKVPQPQVAQQPVEQTEPIPLEEETPEPLTAAALVESTRQFNWTVPDKVITRRLGQAPAREVPKNWLPGIELEDNPFDGMMVPVKTEVVDQWVASDGSRNVVLNTPSGETLCGRAQAWDPMRPMVEHLMMFRTCGGGGKRTFKMPDRFLKNK